MTMNWLEANTLDAQLLGQMMPAPLDAGMVCDDNRLAAEIEACNAEQHQVRHRFEALAARRTAMVDEKHLFDCDSATVRQACGRLVDESWDALLALKRHARRQREMLERMADHLADRQRVLHEQRDRALAKTRRKLLHEHSVYVRQNPGPGQAYIDSLAEGDEAVAGLDQRIHTLDQWQQTLASRRYRLQIDGAKPVARQRAVLTCLMN